ncbi:hypothetical protein, partial [Chelonobacter oris]|uniref:hypothetical protein n=1 Tax=Chelonobacter oris TaxID=505317 RepID=UPI002446CC64
AVVNTGYQLSQDKPYDPYNLLHSELSAVLTRNRTLGQQLSINTGLAAITTTDGQYGANVIGAGLGTLGGYSSSKLKISNKISAPILSNFISEYLSDSERLKLIGVNYEKAK